MSTVFGISSGNLTDGDRAASTSPFRSTESIRDASGFLDSSRNRGNIDITMPVRRAHYVLRKSALANSDKILEREVLREVVEENQRRWVGCLMLPVTILFFTFYAAAFCLHQDISSAALVESPFRQHFLGGRGVSGTNLATDPKTIGDVYDFLRTTYVPTLFKQTDSFGVPLPQDQWNTAFTYNQLIGVVQMEIQRGEKNKCEDKHASHMYCYPTNKLSGKPFGRSWDAIPNGRNTYRSGPDPVIKCDDDGFTVAGCNKKRRLTYLTEDILQMTKPFPRVATEADKTFEFLFHGNETTARQLQRLAYLQDRGWLDEQTTTLAVKALMINNQVNGVPRIVDFRLTYYFSRGGGVYASFDMEAVALTMFTPAAIAMDILFCCMLIASTIFMIRMLYRAFRERKLKYHFTGVNIVTWLTVIMGWLNIVLLAFAEWYRSDIKTSLMKWQNDKSTENAIKMYDYVTKTTVYDGIFMLFVAYAHLVFMARVFMSLQWQPRLAVVMETLAATWIDLFHFGIVLSLTFLAFAIAGVMMFGRTVKDFSTVITAVATCFNIGMMAQWNWVSLSWSAWGTAFFWSTLYMIMVVNLMLNMLLAIIMDVYQGVRTQTGDTMTIWDHILYIYRRLFFRAKWVTDRQLLEKVSEMPQIIVVTELRQAFPHMHEYQLEHLMTACANKAQVVSRVGFAGTFTAQMVAAIHLSLEEVLKDLETMKHRGWMGKGMEVGNDTDRENVKDILTSVAVQSYWMDLMQKNMLRISNNILGVVEEPSHSEHMDRSPSRYRTIIMPKLAPSSTKVSLKG